LRARLHFFNINHGCGHENGNSSLLCVCVDLRSVKRLLGPCARSATCDAPGCQSQAVNADLDHTVPWPHGLTDQCNLSPRCRTHHRAKQSPDWKVDQTAPGVTRWTLPSGRTHNTTPTKYDT
jgi:hypothetical protein